MAANRSGERIPHSLPHPFDNTLLIQANPQEWAQINNLLRQIDIAPRQVLIEVKIYELDLTGAFSEGISAYMQQKGTDTGLQRALNIATGSGGSRTHPRHPGGQYPRDVWACFLRPARPRAR